MSENQGAARQAPPTPADKRIWRSAWTNWPGSGEPLLLLASPGRPYHPGRYTADQADAWFCATSLQMADWTGDEPVIPTLSALSVHVGGPRLLLLVARRPWLEPVTDYTSSHRDCERAALYEHTIVGVLFTTSHPAPLVFPELHRALLSGSALIGDAPVTTAATHT